MGYDFFMNEVLYDVLLRSGWENVRCLGAI